jgi:hypothetical protein
MHHDAPILCAIQYTPLYPIVCPIHLYDAE